MKVINSITWVLYDKPQKHGDYLTINEDGITIRKWNNVMGWMKPVDASKKKPLLTPDKDLKVWAWAEVPLWMQSEFDLATEGKIVEGE